MSGKRRNNRTRRAVLAVLFILTAALLPGAEKFTYFGDAMNVTLSEGSQRALLTGHARVDSQDLRITADQIDLFGKDFIYAQCRGNVHVVDTKRGLDLTSQLLFYDRDQKIARVQGNAVMADVKNEMTVKAGYIEDRDTEKITIMQVGVRIFKKDIVCRSEFARYQRDKKILELSGMPWVSKGNDIYEGSRITINLDTEEIQAEGSIKGSFEDKSKSQSESSGTGQGTTPAAGAQGSGATSGTSTAPAAAPATTPATAPATAPSTGPAAAPPAGTVPGASNSGAKEPGNGQ
ncbi:MAG: LptA/OstA family protein [Spirochaetia bacterium]|jgi:lipopolysaccharide export system protein LptA